ncbi:MAG: arabinogalactan oligomer / maltooligosaccharide transport system substrate-binding protein [Gaiellaceae bacterium]|jgi:arabinogalactan oligomer/maltooligosaccharide transport system substrate-binding protein|nr:arabinogalactan oligomer / maltooligosaccharide transport system substrate-binding protein [Gaiellaceae bacterium]
MKKRFLRLGTLLALAAAVASLVATSVAPAAHQKAGATTFTVWADHDRLPAVKSVVGAWANSKGVTLNVVEKQFGNIRDDLTTVQPSSAPDAVVGPNDWVGQLAADGLVLPIFPRAALKKLIPSYALQGFSYGSAGRLYAAPIALENIGLVVNLSLAHKPKNWKDLESQALKFKKKASGNLAIAVQQGSGGDPYHMYPFFSGLCGYVFGKNKAGTLNANDLGVANKKFLKNAPLIDKWNKEGLVNSKIDGGTAQNAFLKGKAAFWVTGPWNIDTIKTAGIKFAVVQVPKIKCRSVPFLGANGIYVTKYSTQHGVESLAKDLVASYMLGTDAQAAFANINGRSPANTKAIGKVANTYIRQFGVAGKGGVPLPNIPQMASVWSDLGSAWIKSTQGSGATKAKTAFTVAARNIKAKIAGG